MCCKERELNFDNHDLKQGGSQTLKPQVNFSTHSVTNNSMTKPIGMKSSDYRAKEAAA